MVKYIELTQGKRAIVDDEDFEWLNQYRWSAAHTKERWSAVGPIRGEDGKNKTIAMHRLILNAPNGMFVDHINHDPLDNRRANIRLCTPAENTRNRRPQKNGSGYKGVRYKKNQNLWEARIRLNGKRRSIGYYATAVRAAIAYDKAAREMHGEFAHTNFNDGVVGQMGLPIAGIEVKRPKQK